MSPANALGMISDMWTMPNAEPARPGCHATNGGITLASEGCHEEGALDRNGRYPGDCRQG